MACAVRAITGVEAVAGSALSLRIASQPSTPGRLRSIRIRSKEPDRARANPEGPSTAASTANPRRASRRESMSRFISLSSTSRIRGMGGEGPRAIDAGRGGPGRLGLYGGRLDPTREVDCKRRAAARLTQDGDLAAHHLAVASGDGQAEAGPSILPGGRGVGLDEREEEAVDLLGGH